MATIAVSTDEIHGSVKSTFIWLVDQGDVIWTVRMTFHAANLGKRRMNLGFERPVGSVPFGVACLTESGIGSGISGQEYP